jgi:soluble lytic murein transglycosylase
LVAPFGSRPVAQSPLGDAPKAFELVSTVRPTLPRNLTRVWLADEGAGLRSRSAGALAQFAEGVRLLASGDPARAVILVSTPALGETVLADYATYYTGLAKMSLGDAVVARRLFATVRDRQPEGFLREAAVLREAEAAEMLGDLRGAIDVLEPLAKGKTSAPDVMLARLGRLAQAAGDRPKAVTAFTSLYYEHPLSELASDAGEVLDDGDLPPWSTSSERFRLEIGRAERLFGAKRYAAARDGFAQVQPYASGREQELVLLRIAECDLHLKKSIAARATLKALLDGGVASAEARFAYLTATRDVGSHDEYIRLSRRLVAEYPETTWAEETLNNLATHYIVRDDDESADGVFRELYRRFPASQHAPRAAWKAGWRAFRNGQYRETVQFFESAAVTFPRSDYRPAFLYWAAKAHDRLDERSIATDRYRLVIADYQNSYYGRLASGIIGARGERFVREGSGQAGGELAVPARLDIAPALEQPTPPPTHALIGVLIDLELYDQALDELSYAQQVWGGSSLIDATYGYVYNRKGELRRAINAVKRAYPQYIAAGGEHFSSALLRVLFPLDYWDLIRKHASLHGLDPYLMAALIAQESTFDPVIKSSANAVGLMQLMPSTGRAVARSLKLRYTPAMLTRPEHNIQLGMKHFAGLVKKLGGVHLALASYNAGEQRVVRWLEERGGVDRDEFIDDIPYPETQNYVKKILGTAEDYRRLYGDAEAAPVARVARATVSQASGSPKTSRSATTKKTRSTTKKPAAKKPSSKTAKAAGR